MVMVCVALATSFSGDGDVASMIGKCQRHRVGARNIGARVARFDVHIIRVSDACTISKCPLYNTGKSVVDKYQQSSEMLLLSHSNVLYVL
jgi:hypothetical protein